MKRQATPRENTDKTFLSQVTLSRIHKELSQLDNKNITQLEKWVNI